MSVYERIEVMEKKFNILLCNDDGVNAEGLVKLYQCLARVFDNITVVAPDRNCSGLSHSLTLQNPLRVNKLENGFYSVNGTLSIVLMSQSTSYVNKSPMLLSVE